MKQPKRIVDCGKTDNFHIERTYAVELFFRDARKYSVLSQSEEHRFLVLAQRGTPEESKEAKKRLVESNQLFVASVAKKFNTNGNFLDIVNEGNIGLLMAIERFDLSSDNSFLSYAVHWIKKRINDYNVKYSLMVRPKNANLVYTYARKARNQFFLKNERYPSLEELKNEIKDMFDVVVSDKSDLEQFTVNTIMNERERDAMYKRNESDGSPIGLMTDYESATSTNNVSEDSDHSDSVIIVQEMLARLSDEKRDIIKRLYGIDSDIEETPDSIALRMGMSVNKVKRIANEALVEMRCKSVGITI